MRKTNEAIHRVAEITYILRDEEMGDELLGNLDKLHTTKLGVERIKKNLGLDTDDVVAWCRLKTQNADDITRKGKNYYVFVENSILTINAHSFTIITAHKEKIQNKHTPDKTQLWKEVLQ